MARTSYSSIELFAVSTTWTFVLHFLKLPKSEKYLEYFLFQIYELLLLTYYNLLDMAVIKNWSWFWFLYLWFNIKYWVKINVRSASYFSPLLGISTVSLSACTSCLVPWEGRATRLSLAWNWQWIWALAQANISLWKMNILIQDWRHIYWLKCGDTPKHGSV